MPGLYIDILAKVVTKLSTYIIEHQYIVYFCHVLSIDEYKSINVAYKMLIFT